jgi:hypothetical protein
MGFLAPFLFVITAIVGGALRPGYRHVTDTVSELFSPGSPNRLVLSLLYTLFAVSLTLFGLGLLRFVLHTGNFKTIGVTASMAFISVGVLHILSATIFPQDAWGSPPTLFGRLHIILHGLISLLSLLYILLFGVWFYRTGIAKYFRVYSIATIIGVVLAAVWMILSYGDPLMGISERAAALLGFQWTIVLAAVVMRDDRSSRMNRRSPDGV